MENIPFRGEGAVEFDEVLGRLKREGCNLLLTGEVPAEVSDAATRRLLGAPFERRRRVLAFADAAADRVTSRLPGGCRPSDDDVTVIERRGTTRSAAAEPAGDRGFPVVGVGADLSAFESAILDAVEAYDRRDGGLEPAELRLSLDSVGLLVDDHGADAVAGFLESVTATVAGVRGMAHYHLPVPDGADTVGALTPLFDARIELRQRDGFAPEQRWHLPSHGLTTDWVGL